MPYIYSGNWSYYIDGSVCLRTHRQEMDKWRHCWWSQLGSCGVWCLISMLWCSEGRLVPTFHLALPSHRQQRHTDQSLGRGGGGGCKEGRRWLQHVAEIRRSTEEEKLPSSLCSCLLTPWHGRNVQIKETSKARMWEGIGRKRDAALTRWWKTVSIILMSVKC